MLSKRSKICFGLLLVFFTIFGLSLSVSEDVSAANLSTNSFDMYLKSASGLDYTWYTNVPFNSYAYHIDAGGGLLQYRINTGTTTAQGNYAALHFETNIVAEGTTVDLSAWNTWYHLDYQNIITCAASQNGITVNSKNLSYAVTNWSYTDSQLNTYFESTLTFYGDVVLAGFTSGQSVYFTCAIGSTNYSFAQVADNHYGVRVYFEQNPMTINWTNNATDSLLNIQINQTNEYYTRDYEATSNISNQSTNSIPNSTSDQTTSIIGTISSFVSALGTVQSTNCVLTLPFPTFAGGDTVVDVCSGKEHAPTIVTVGSSLFLIGIFIPFAFIVLKMIYNEIRSYTDG